LKTLASSIPADLSNQCLQLIEIAEVQQLAALRDGESWRLELRLSTRWLAVRSRREPIRHWRSLTAVGRFCAGLWSRR
jgi:hypothetical protein